MKVLAIIPAFNEEKSIEAVVKMIKAALPGIDTLVVNDGSSDNTTANALKAGSKVITLPFNLGIGGAMQTGYIYAHRNNYDIAIQVDGDGQHNPDYIETLIEPLKNGTADMAIGSRYVNKSAYKSTLARRTGMVFFSSLVKLLTGKSVKDTTSGFRAANRKIIEYFALHYPTDYPEVDVLIKLHKKNYKVVEIPVEMNERKTGKSSITPLRSIYYMIKVSLSLLIGAIRSAES